MDITWNFAITICYLDNSIKEIGVVKDDSGMRFTAGTIDDFNIAITLPKLNAFLLAIGYGVSPPPTPPENVKDYTFRFSAVTIGSINVLGSSSDVDGEALSNDLDAATAALNADNDFVSLFPSSEEPRIALLANTAYVDYIIGDPARGASNLQASFESLGLAVHPFTDISDVGIINATAGRCILVIPELESGPLYPSLSDDAKAAIFNFVTGGGTLMMFSNKTRVLDVVNGIFGPSLGTSLSPDITRSPIKIDDPSGTPFDGGPVEIAVNSSTGSLDNAGTNSLISFNGAKSIYREDNAAGNVTVFLIPFYGGRIVLFGWNWRDAAPVGSQDGNWLEVLRRATLFCL